MTKSGCLKGKKALVTGATRGIGLAAAMRLSDAGAEVWITGTSKKSNAGKFNFLVADFSKSSATEKFAKKIGKGGFDILVNNAGINKISPFCEISPDDFDKIQEVNLRAPFLLCQAVLPYMKKNKWGRIVNVSSVFGKITKEQRASYSASKFALDGMTAALAVEVASSGILANCVAPGFVDTELTRAILGNKGARKLAATVPMKRLAKPDEIAALIAWLCSPDNTFLTAQNIVIDGGFVRV